MDAEGLNLHTLDDKDTLVFSGKVIAENVTYEDYLAGLHGEHAEWFYGVVIAMSPIHILHNRIVRFLSTLFDVYLELTTGGEVLLEPMVMKPGEDFPARQPDLQVLLPDRLPYLQETQVAGPANLVVEVISPESVRRDRGEKFDEYERGGVAEYWLIDPQRKEALFYVRGENNLFESRLPQDGRYTSHVLAQLQLHVDIFWQEKPPGVRETVRMVEVMLGENG